MLGSAWILNQWITNRKVGHHLRSSAWIIQDDTCNGCRLSLWTGNGMGNNDDAWEIFVMTWCGWEWSPGLSRKKLLSSKATCPLIHCFHFLPRSPMGIFPRRYAEVDLQHARALLTGSDGLPEFKRWNLTGLMRNPETKTILFRENDMTTKPNGIVHRAWAGRRWTTPSNGPCKNTKPIPQSSENLFPPNNHGTMTT